MLGALALAAGACGSGGSASPAHLSAGSPTGTGAAGAAGPIVSTASVDGTTALVAADGHTLYFARGEAPDHIVCVGACTGIWRPVMASRPETKDVASTLARKLSVTARPGGGRQLVYAGHPLYVFTVEGPHQMRGDGATDEFNGTRFEWSAATTGAASAHPSGPGSTSTGRGGHGNGGGGYGY